jgi:hypothetical protein
VNSAPPNRTRSSAFWCAYFHRNSSCASDLPWDVPYRLTTGERTAITKSIQQFQLGEGSAGKRLLQRGEAFARAASDADFVAALTLFIREEQRHSAHLGRFMDQQGIPIAAHHWVDRVFRQLRGLAGLELSLRVLVTAELIAVPYYRALRDATASPLLRALCGRILRDEAGHLRFQAWMLARLGLARSRRGQWLSAAAHGVFLLGTSLLVWIEHHRVFIAAGYRLDQFLEETLLEFLELNITRREFVKSRQRHRPVGPVAESVPEPASPA